MEKPGEIAGKKDKEQIINNCREELRSARGRSQSVKADIMILFLSLPAYTLVSFSRLAGLRACM